VNVHVFDTADQAAVALARRVADAVAADPALRLGLAAGETPVPAYEELVRLHRDESLDLSRIHTFNLDEFVGLAPDQAGSFRSAMQAHLFDRVNIDPAHVEFLDGTASDLDEECQRYEAAIRREGGLDLQVLGIGMNGHLGFNEPAAALHARTHRVVLHEDTRRANAAAFGGDVARVPSEALSMGMGTILQAKALLLLATGPRKAPVVERALNGPLTTMLPASFLQTHRTADVFLDRAAASLLNDYRLKGVGA
jgi:glucosamine-6-phosphate deaminase